MKKALKIRFIFKDSVLFNLNVMVAPLSVNISKQDISEEIGSLASFVTISTEEKNQIPGVLIKKVFEKRTFEKIQIDLNNRIKERALAKKQRPESAANAKAGPVAMHNMFFVAVMFEKITVHCVKDNQCFVAFDVMELQYRVSPKQDFLVTIGKLSLVPADSYYDNFFVTLSPKHPMKAEMYKDKETGYPTLLLQNCKVVFMNRILQELKKFKKEITDEISVNSKVIMSRNSVYQKTSFQEEQKKEVEPEKKPLFQIKIENSCFVVPRTTNSKDSLVLFTNLIEVKIDKETHEVDMPTPLTEEFTIIGKKQILRDENTFQQVKADFTIAEVDALKGEAFYIIGDRKTHLGQSDAAHITAVVPSKRVIKDDWIFDTLVEAHLGSFLFSMNMAAIDEVKNIVLDNLKEPSKHFQLSSDNFENVQLNIAGKKISFSMNKANIPVERVEEILNEKPKYSIKEKKNEDDGKNYEQYLDDVIGSMMALRKY